MSDFDRIIERYPQTIHVWRTVGRSSSDGVLRYGLMHKNGVRDDVVNQASAYYAVIYVLRGTGVYHSSTGASWPLAPGAVFQRMPGERHSTILDPDSQWVECYVCFGGGLARSLIDAGMIDPKRPVIDRGIDPVLAERILAGLVSLRAAQDHDLPIELGHSLAVLCELLRVPIRPTDQDQGLVSAACSRLGEDLSRPCQPRQLARELGCDYERFRKLFQHRTGMSPLRWRMRRRMERARELLLDGSLSIARVAALVGFSDPTLFTTRFRRHCGMSPRRFRLGSSSTT